MIVLLCGMPRSASTWSYNVCRAVVEASGRRLHPKSALHEPDDFPNPDDFDVGEEEVLLLKCHHPPSEVLREACEGKSAIDRVVFTVRDPRAAAASLTRTFGTSFKNAAREIQRSLLIWDELRASGTGLILPYMQITEHPADAVRDTAYYLGLDLADETCERIAGDLSRDKLLKKVSALEDDSLRQLGGSSHDPETLLTRQHFSGEQETDWRRHLSPVESRFATRTWRSWIERLGVRADDDTGLLSAPAAMLLSARCKLWRETV